MHEQQKLTKMVDEFKAMSNDDPRLDKQWDAIDKQTSIMYEAKSRSEIKSQAFLLAVNEKEMVKKGLKYPSDYIFVGHLHRNVYVTDKKTSIFVLGSSGCTLTNVTSFVEIVYDNELIVNTKYVTYDRKLYDRKVKEIDFPYTLE